MLSHSTETTSVFGFILMAIAAIGILTSTVYLGLVLVAAARQRRLAERAQAAVDYVKMPDLPAVCILKPVHGLEPRLFENLESFFRQDYPAYEIVFGTRTTEDPALTVVDELRQKYPYIPVRVIYSGEPEWPNAKVYSLDKMIASTRCNHFVISDSDILVAPDFLRNVITPLLRPENGLVTCLYRGIPAKGVWSEVEAIGMSVEMPSGVIVADMLEGMRFALGAVMAVRRDALDKIGGISMTADYYSDDFVLGNLIAQAGYKVVLSHHRVGHVLVGNTFRNTFSTQLRWAKSTRYSRPAGHIGEGLTYATPYGLLAVIAGFMMGNPLPGVAAALWTFVARTLQAQEIGWNLIGDRRALRRAWLYPVRDLIGFFVWAGSFLGGSSFAWRGETYEFTPGGRIIPATRKAEALEEVSR
jgi:ceramide glucosyltransferase